jgi:hypothetical protein
MPFPHKNSEPTNYTSLLKTFRNTDISPLSKSSNPNLTSVPSLSESYSGQHYYHSLFLKPLCETDRFLHKKANNFTSSALTGEQNKISQNIIYRVCPCFDNLSPLRDFLTTL